MYTGHRINNDQIYQDETKTQFGVIDDRIQSPLNQPTGYYLLDGMVHDVRHIYGPDGYTKYYIQNGHIYGPDTELPWLEGFNEAI
jgi:hypothetical protein